MQKLYGLGVMSNYHKGYKFEKEVIQFYKDQGYFCLRSAGSHTPVDVLAIDDLSNHVFFIQCKYGNTRMTGKEIQSLLDLAKRYGATPILATKEKYKSMKLTNIECGLNGKKRNITGH